MLHSKEIGETAPFLFTLCLLTFQENSHSKKLVNLSKITWHGCGARIGTWVYVAPLNKYL